MAGVTLAQNATWSVPILRASGLRLSARQDVKNLLNIPHEVKLNGHYIGDMWGLLWKIFQETKVELVVSLSIDSRDCIILTTWWFFIFDAQIHVQMKRVYLFRETSFCAEFTVFDSWINACSCSCSITFSYRSETKTFTSRASSEFDE